MFWLLASLAMAQDCPDKDILLVGVEHSPPFSILEEGKWSGISVELWEKVAFENQISYQYVPSSLHQAMDGLDNCQLDVALTGIAITPDREKRFNFSHSYFIEEVAVATNLKDDIFAKVGVQLAKPTVFLLGLLLFFGIMYCLLEKTRTVSDLLSSIYWAMITLTTVGYGDESPKTTPGKILAMIWTFMSLFILATIVTQISSAFQAVNWFHKVDHLSDLKGQKVITLKDSLPEQLLQKDHIEHYAAETEKEMFDKFDSKEYNFIIYDRSVIKFHRTVDTIILEKDFYDQHIAFAVREGIALENINRSMLDAINSDWWTSVTYKYQNPK